MSRQSSPNYMLAAVVLLLVLMGILTLASASVSASWEESESTSYFLRHQLLWGLLPGLLLAGLAFKIPFSYFKKYSLWAYLTTLALTALVLVPQLGVELGGSARWLKLGPIAIQTSELLKLGVILYFSFWLSQVETEGKIPIISFFVILLPAVLILALQPNTSALVLISAVAGLMYFAAKTPVWHSVVLGALGVGGLLAFIKLAPYRMSRFIVFLRPNLDPMGIGYQLKQALIGIGSGGIWGKGLGFSRQKFGFLPHAMSDSIFAVLGEEAGFIGGLLLILLFVLLLWFGLKVSQNASSQFGKLTALGITCWISLQAFVNIGAMTAVLPLTGIPLPFISYGGSHLIAELIGVGILLNISKS